MPYDKFLIAPFNEDSGLTTNVKPWQIPDQAWEVLDNMYVFRGRLKKRFGSRYMNSAAGAFPASPLTSRFRIQVGTIGAPTSPVPGSIFQPGQQFSAGSQIFTVTTIGTPAAMLATGPGTGTFNTTTGAFVLAGTGLAGGTPIYFYPGLPVMGLTQYEFTTINSYISFGFDTQFSYIFASGAWALSNNSPTWHGSDINFFWAYNWVGPNAAATALIRALFVTNFYVTNINGAGTANDDPVYYWNGTTWTAYKAYLNPGAGNAPGTGPFVETARIIVVFHGRLVYLNTIENDGGGGLGINTNFVNRARYTSLGSPFAVNAWYGVGAADNAGNIGITAGFEDASTLEAIISAEFVKDRLIVYFEESTWELAYTANEQRPFQWNKLNTELGSQATFSTIAFDKAALTVGETGINSCNGSNVIRIDQKIPDEIFKISNPTTEVERICGIRDYYNELVYWSLPVSSQRSVQPYPTRILVYNYQNETWAFNDDVITAYGYFDGQAQLTWATCNFTWAEWLSPWSAGEQQQQVRQVIGGNQQGFTFILDADNNGRNAGVLQITAMVQAANGITMTIYNHMLISGDYIYVEFEQGVVLNGFGIYIVLYIDQNTILAYYPIEVVNSTSPPTYPTFTGTYTGGGTVARVSNYKMYSKQWNPYDKDGSNVYVAKIDFNVTKTTSGQVTVDYSPSSTPLSSITEGKATASILGTSVLETTPFTLYPLESQQERLWHPVYFQSEGECIQIKIYMSPLQMCVPLVGLTPASFDDFEINGLVLNTAKVGRLQ